MIPIDGHPIVPVPDPHADYAQCVGLTMAATSDGNVLVGTGTLIDADGGVGILTCAHNVFDEGTGRPALWIVFVPALTVGETGDVVFSALREQIRIPAGYHGGGSVGTATDYAVVRLRAESIPVGLYPLPTMEMIPVARLGNVQVTGYPDEPAQPNPAMYFSRGAASLDPANPNLLRYKASTRSGSSGSGVCRVAGNPQDGEVPELETITAVHVRYDDDDPLDVYNVGVYLTVGVIEWVQGQLVP
jgi:hypothetical protein